MENSRYYLCSEAFKGHKGILFSAQMITPKSRHTAGVYTIKLRTMQHRRQYDVHIFSLRHNR
jgi:hypothetical protein